MTTPNRKAIIEKAVELWRADQFKSGSMQLAQLNPEIEELREGGYLSSAQSELMRDSSKAESVEWENYNENLENSNDFTVDIKQLFESGGLILGSKHTGKSDLAMQISDQAMQKNAIVVVFDPSLDWITRSSIKQYLKVEPYSNLDIPSESVIYDVSLLSPNQQQAIVERFSKSLFEYQVKTLNRKEYLVIFEESHTYFYQNVMRSKNAVNSVRMLSVGRNVEICCLLISQFASMLDKFAIKHSVSQIYLGFTKEPNDLKYLKQFLGSEVQQLTKLNDGEFIYLTRNNLSKIQIEPYENHTIKTRIAIPEPTIQPIPQTKQNNTHAISSLIVAFMWFAAIVLALHGRGL